MHASILLAIPFLTFAYGQDSGAIGCQGSITANRCCDGDVITSDGQGIDTGDISNLICCEGGSGSTFNFGTGGATTCSAGLTAVPFSELASVGGSSDGSTTMIVVVGGTTVMSSMGMTESAETTTMNTTVVVSSSSMSAEDSSDATMTSSGMTASESGDAAAESSTDSSTGAAALMTSGPMAGALVMAGGFMMAAF